MKTCAVDGCDEPSRSRGWCHRHYTQWRRTGEVETTRRWKHQPATCSVDGCFRKTLSRGMCSTHYTRWWKHGDPLANLQWLKVPTYGAVHRRIGKLKTGTCRTCGKSGRTEMALLAGRGNHIQRGGYGDGRAYSDRAEDYAELCASCHKRYDGIVANLGVEPGIKICSVQDCERTHLARGYCGLHYSRWKSHGDPLGRDAR